MIPLLLTVYCHVLSTGPFVIDRAFLLPTNRDALVKAHEVIQDLEYFYNMNLREKKGTINRLDERDDKIFNVIAYRE